MKRLLKEGDFEGLLNEEEFKKYHIKIAQSVILGNSAKKLFRNVVSILENGHTFAYDYQEQELKSDMVSQIIYWAQYLKMIKEQITDKEFEFWKEALLYGGKEFANPISLHDQDGPFFQRRELGFIREDGQSFLKEIVFNYMDENSNQPFSFLIFEDLKTGLKLDLQQLLPSEILFRFSPSVLIPYKYGERKKIVLKERKDLKDYYGTKFSQKSEGDLGFMMSCAAGKGGTIVYENLVKKGGMLSLLHEISHAWQSKGCNFCKLEKFFQILETLAFKEVPEEKIQKFLSRYENICEIAFDSFKEEKDAWESSKQIIMFLRDQGVDLEPQICSNEDFSTIAEENLETYRFFIRDKFQLLNIKFPI